MCRIHEQRDTAHVQNIHHWDQNVDVISYVYVVSCTFVHETTEVS